MTGAELAARIAARMGFPAADAATVAALARHHLLLPDTATRRDLEDPSTVAIVVSAIGGSAELLELLHHLTIADAEATGPAAWSDWKAALVGRAGPGHRGGARRRAAAAAATAVAGGAAAGPPAAPSRC